MNDILNDHDGFGRRRFIRALGAGAATVLAACAGSPVAESPKSRPSLTRATAVNHVAYAVTDYARTRDFYVEMFGMRVAWDDGTKCSVEFGDPARPDAFYIVAAKPGEKAYVNHIGYSIDDFVGNKSAIAAELKRRNTQFKADTEQGWTLEDPSGFTIHFISETGIFPGASAPCAVMNSSECSSANAVGLKKLAQVPTPSGRGFKAIAFSHIVQCVRNVEETRDFYRDLFGMREVRSTPGEAILRFGNDTLVLLNSTRAEKSPYIDHFALEVDAYDQAKVEAELKRRGYEPRPESRLAWTIRDPEGMRVEVAGPRWAEYVSLN